MLRQPYPRLRGGPFHPRVLPLPVTKVAQKDKQLRREKERLYYVLRTRLANINFHVLVEADYADKERLDYLQSINLLLKDGVKYLGADLGLAKPA